MIPNPGSKKNNIVWQDLGSALNPILVEHKEQLKQAYKDITDVTDQLITDPESRRVLETEREAVMGLLDSIERV